MNKVKLRFTQKPINSYKGALQVFLVAQSGKSLPKSDQSIRSVVRELAALGDFKGQKDESIILYPDNVKAGKQFSCKRLLLVGIGELKKNISSDKLLETCRSVGGTISQSAKKVKADELLLLLPEFLSDPQHSLAAAVVEGILLGNYSR